MAKITHMNYFIYILRTSSNTLYIGQTNNLDKRIKEHQEKKGKGAKYMRSFDSFKLVYTEKFESRTEAMKRENQLKKLTKKEKEKLITSCTPSRLDTFTPTVISSSIS